MFSKILIANRGEIAVRVIRTARRMGIATVAVYSDADRAAMHVALADEAVHIGPAPARESYLNSAAILEACRRTGAEAVHPGYGFLSENATFAETLEQAGLVFIGPPSSAIRAMGSKSEAKALMEKAGVPLVPGYHGADQDPDLLAREAERIGYPVLIKASAGGGGKGMRRVDDPRDFAEALAGARREALSAFGDDRVLVEKYVLRPRHIEMQVFADSHGNAVHLFERDCSLQRRHQKVIEEAPAPGLSEAMRARMGEAAVEAARTIGYRGAGTVEFIAGTDAEHRPTDFFFMEMNTRLQVEHPVTEMITGQDLVEWQLRVAWGETLPLRQEDIRADGHAFEVRLYAEDVPAGFLPSTGQLARLVFPETSAHVRVDTGVAEGDSVTIHYDPMIAKLIAWDHDRAAALGRLRRALAATELAGPVSNRDFLAALAAHPDFAAGKVDTGFIEARRAALIPEPGPADATVLALACLDELVARTAAARAQAAARGRPQSPWASSDGWRLGAPESQQIVLQDHAGPVVIHAWADGPGWRLTLPDGRVCAVRGGRDSDGRLVAEVDGHRLSATVARHDADRTVILPERTHRLTLIDPMAQAAGGVAEADGSLTAPMPGKVIDVSVVEGQQVAAGQTLLILEAMKMEHSLRAPFDGVVSALRCAPGDQVGEGTVLAIVEADDPGS